MGYIGSKPATNFETVRKQVSTTNSGTTITLDYSVSSVQDILVTVNAVVQSYDNYSVSGTTLTLGGTLNNDRVEILYVGRTFQTVSPAVGTVTNDMLSGSIANSKLVNSSITLNGSAVSLGGSVSGIGEITPAFAVRKTDGDQGYSQNTWTKVGFNLELLDTNNAFSSNTFTVPSGEEGTYLFHVMAQMGSVSSGSAYHIKLYVNGSDYSSLVQHATSTAEYPLYAGVQAVDLSVGDYVEVFGLSNGGAGNFVDNKCQFTGFKLGA